MAFDLSQLHREIGRSFAERNVVPWTIAIPIQDIHRWADELAASRLPASGRCADACREAHRILAEAQLMLGHCLVVHDRGALVPGGRIYVEDDHHVQLGLDDWYFWTYLSLLWESLYRSWERQARFLRTVFLPHTFEEQRLARRRWYLPQVIEALQSEWPALPGLIWFQRLLEKAGEREIVSRKRNELSHHASSLFARVDANFAETGILSASGRPLIVHENLVPDAANELDLAVRSYMEAGLSFLALRDLLDECLSRGILRL